MSRSSKQKPLFREIWDILASTELAILLLILLAVASLLSIAVGEYLRRAVRFQSPAEALGASRYLWFQRLGLFHPYQSWWYATLLGMLGLSLLACSVNRLKATFRAAFSLAFKRSPDAIEKLACARAFRLRGDAYETFTRISRLLRRRLYRVAESAEEGAYYLAAGKGGVGRLGPLFTHLGIIALLVGGIYGARTGYRTMRYAQAGDTVDVPRRGPRRARGEMETPPHAFKVRVDSLWMAVTEDGEIRDWYSMLTVLDPGPVVTRVIEVNHPLRYRGLAFYQASWDEDWRRIARARLAVTDNRTGMRREIVVPFQRRTPLADSTSLNVADFAADFLLDEAGNAQSRTREPRNPAIRIELYDGRTLLGHRWVFLNQPEMHRRGEEPYRIEWLGYDPLYITGLQIAENPGTPLIWLGIGMATIGVCLAFLIVHRRLWAIVLPEGSGTVRVVLGGTSHRNSGGFARELERMVQAIERGQ
jgi:cytochrome c biogenesis protein